MIWLTILPFCLSMSIFLTDWAWSALSKATAPRRCEHPWYMDGRCMECGEPR